MRIIESNKAATDIEINQWEVFFKTRMPDDLKILLIQSNGLGLYSKNIDKELQVLSINEAIEFYQSFHFEKNCQNAIPISMDGCSNMIVYKVNNQKIENIYVMSSSCLEWDSAVILNESISKIIGMSQRIDDIFNNEGL